MDGIRTDFEGVDIEESRGILTTGSVNTTVLRQEGTSFRPELGPAFDALEALKAAIKVCLDAGQYEVATGLLAMLRDREARATEAPDLARAKA